MLTLPGWVTGYGPRGEPFDVRGDWAAYASHIGDYMHRWILRTPWGTLRLHRILREDTDRDLHDHPFDFASLVVSGGYVEVSRGTSRGLVVRVRRPGSVARRRAEDAHAIREVFPGTWTLVLSGAYRRKWGYTTAQGWVYWRDYHGVGP